MCLCVCFDFQFTFAVTYSLYLMKSSYIPKMCLFDSKFVLAAMQLSASSRFFLFKFVLAKDPDFVFASAKGED